MSKATLSVNSLRRVSKASRPFNGHFAGRVNYDFTLTLSTGEVLQLSGDLGMKYSYHNAFGATTDDGVKTIAESTATETRKRLSSVGSTTQPTGTATNP